jgi:hypothetical protein
MAGRKLAWLGSLLILGAVVACQEDLAAPGVCPEFCPADSVATRDTVLFGITGDSATRLYVRPHEAAFLHLVDRASPALDSRVFMVTNVAPGEFQVDTSAALEPVAYTDFARLLITVTRRDTLSQNLTLAFYRLPATVVDSTETFASMATHFSSAPLIRRVNVDSMIANSAVVDTARQDSICGDTLGTRRTGVGGHLDTARVDRALVSDSGRSVTLILVLDSTQFPYSPADSGRAGIGVRVEADTLAQAVLGSLEGNVGASITWFQCFDSLAVRDVRRVRPAIVTNDSYVFSPDTTAIGSDLVVGGMPSARSWLRFNFPNDFLDSNTVVRASLLMMPTTPAQGAASDSFLVEALGVQRDFGAKSILLFNYRGATVGALDREFITMGSTDTLQLEVSPIVRLWALDSLVPKAMVLRATFEGASLAEARFGRSTGAAAFQPRLHVTYVPRYPFRNP